MIRKAHIPLASIFATALALLVVAQSTFAEILDARGGVTFFLHFSTR